MVLMLFFVIMVVVMLNINLWGFKEVDLFRWLCKLIIVCVKINCMKLVYVMVVDCGIVDDRYGKEKYY